jgi:hypothetical protein
MEYLSRIYLIIIRSCENCNNLKTLYHAINNYFDQRRWPQVDRCLEFTEVFLVAYTYLNFEIFVETQPNRQRRCMSILRY